MKRLAMLLIVSCGWSTSALAADSPLDARVTVAFREASAADVIGALARGAGITVRIGPGTVTMRPVTITLTNVKLSNALNAICDNALCIWAFGSSGLHVTPLPSEQSTSLPRQLTFEIHNATAADVFRALAAAIGVPVTIDPNLQSARQVGNAVYKYKGLTADALNGLCEIQDCEWDFDVTRGLRVTRKRAAASAQDIQVYRPGDGVSVPRLVSDVKPAYPEAAKPARVAGTELLSVVVREDGTVGDVTVKKSVDTRYDFDGESVKAVKQWKFKPGMKDGKPVSVVVTVELSFAPPT